MCGRSSPLLITVVLLGLNWVIDLGPTKSIPIANANDYLTPINLFMMKFAQLLVGFYLLQTAAVAQKSSLKPFTLTGVIKGMDSGSIYLNYIPDGGHGILDSCKVINGKFLFKGRISEPTRAIFNTFGWYGVYDDKNYIEFYI